MNIIDYAVYSLSGKHGFKQSLIIDSGHMQSKGVCFGLSIDWMRYNNKHPDKDYIADKYNQKYSTHCKFDIWDGGASVYHTVDSKNYYNRVNYFQKKGGYEYGKAKFISVTDTKNEHIPDSSFIILKNSKVGQAGHACTYKITSTNAGYKYVYFDPNFGETFKEGFNSRNEAVSDLKSLISSEISKYKVLTLGTTSYDKDALLIANSDKFTNYMEGSWKNIKSDIEAHGTHENSMNYSDISNDFLQHDYYHSA